MAIDFSALKSSIANTKEWLQKEYSGLRAGKASPSLLDVVRIDAYGSKMPLNQVASVTIEDSRTLRISPWDSSLVKEIEKAITDADLGVSSATDDKGVRVHFPELTSERRQQIVKVAKDKLEQARITLRGHRDDVWGTIQQQERDGEISEDDKFRLKDDMQKIVDEANKALEALYEKKEQEIAL